MNFAVKLPVKPARSVTAMTFTEQRPPASGPGSPLIAAGAGRVSSPHGNGTTLGSVLLQAPSRSCSTVHAPARGPRTKTRHPAAPAGRPRSEKWPLLDDQPSPEDQASGLGGQASRLEAQASGTESVSRWNAEWNAWCAQSTSRTAVARWANRHSCLAGLTGLEEILAACGEDRLVPQDVADQRLAAVVSEARNGDTCAARVALHRVFPALVHRAAARAWSDGRPLGLVLDDLMGAAWLVIVDYPLQRRPVKIAVNVVRDAENRVFGYIPAIVRNAVRGSVEDLPDRMLAHALTGPSVEGDPQDSINVVPKLLLDAVGPDFSVRDARLLAQLFLSELSTNEIAEAEGCSSRYVRMRRQWALDRLAAQLGPDPRVVRGRNSSSEAAFNLAGHGQAVPAHG